MEKRGKIINYLKILAFSLLIIVREKSGTSMYLHHYRKCTP